MQRFKNILLVLNPEIDEQAAIEKAVALAKKNQAKLTLFSVLERQSDLVRSPEQALMLMLEGIATERSEWMDRQLAPIREQGVDVSSIVVAETPFLAIIRQVLSAQHDLVVITAEEKKGIRARLFGTTSMHLMRKCPCPVWVVKRTHIRPYTRILAAIDPSIGDQQKDSLNPLILQLADGLATDQSAELHIVHAWHLFGEAYSRGRGMSAEDVEEAKYQQKKRIKLRLDSLLNGEGLAHLKPRVHLLEGKAEERISELVVDQGIDLLIMGTVCRTGVAGFLIGNTAEEVLNQVDCSVLTVKPEGFLTPVTLE